MILTKSQTLFSIKRELDRVEKKTQNIKISISTIF